MSQWAETDVEAAMVRYCVPVYEMDFRLSSILMKLAWTLSEQPRPASIGLTPLLSLTKSATPQCFSRALIEYDTLGCVAFRSPAAFLKFRCLAAASNTNSECGEGRRDRKFDINY